MSEKHIITACISFQPMQLQHARRWSKTRSVPLEKWPKCSQFSGRHDLFEYQCVNVSVFVCVCVYCMLLKWRHKVSSMIRVQWSFLTCLSIGVFPAERRVKMCWRLRAWRPLACCRAEYSLEADRLCRVVSTWHSKSLFSILYAIFVGSFLHLSSSSAIGLFLSLSKWLSIRVEQCSELCFRYSYQLLS